VDFGMNFDLPVVETEGDELRLESMIDRIRQLERESVEGELPPDIVLALSSMKEEIGSLQTEMDSIKNEVSEAVRVIQRETATMLAQVAEMEKKEREEMQNVQQKEGQQ
jgi:hypothetical protein